MTFSSAEYSYIHCVRGKCHGHPPERNDLYIQHILIRTNCVIVSTDINT
jgi:hypothetical protein